MLDTLGKIVVTGAVSAIAGCIIIFLGLLASMLPYHLDEYVGIIGGLFVYYLFAVVAMFVSLIIFSPIYLVLKKFGFANCISLFLIGVFAVFAIYRFDLPIREFYFALAGGVSFSLFHYGFTMEDVS